jgi:hypothetical protein
MKELGSFEDLKTVIQKREGGHAELFYGSFEEYLGRYKKLQQISVI